MMSSSIVYNSDCLEAMRAMPDRAFDICIADPPYGLDKKILSGGKNGHVKFHIQYGESQTRWDKKPDAELFDEVFRVSKNQIIWGGNYFGLPPNRCFVIWDKVQPEECTFSMAEYAWCSFESRAQIYRQSVLTNHGKIHPTEKPIKLYRWLLEKFAKSGDRVLDPFLGSGSSRIACHEMGFDFVGYELDKEYYDAQEKRFAKYLSQGKLFEPMKPFHEQTALL